MARARQTVTALAYPRTSSATNVGEDKDSDKRQRAAIQTFARRAGFEIVGEFYDDAVRGEDDLSDRPGFSAMLDHIEGNGVRVVIIEDATRFARKVLTQELGIVSLLARQVTVWSARGEMNLTETDDEFKVAMRQIAAVFSELEKKRLVKKLKGARDRKRARSERTTADGRPKLEGRQDYAELSPAAVELAHKLRRKRPKGGQRTLREIADKLAKAGFMTRHGKPYAAAAVAKMLAA